ncbi:uncharacterized protein LOC135829279 [Sycon ciliatum]|uniref:uncharacterized protein LOC135829279 n=1 Tax=Sycon ciliatum TaxID=27933 RepID=UPI0031F6A391
MVQWLNSDGQFFVTETFQTENFPYADVPVNGLVVDLSEEHETCGWIHLYQSGQYISEIICVNPVNGNATKCYDQGGSYGYTSTTLGSPDGKYIYGLTSTGYVIKYYVPDVTPSPIVVPRCPYYRYAVKPNWGNYYTPNSAWFSYDHSRIFLNNGLTLSASSDQTEDLQEHGSFNGSFSSQNIYWVDQDAKLTTHEVVTLQRIYDYEESMYKLVVLKYAWPFLEAMSSHIDIPVPTSPAGLKVNTYGVGSQVYFGTSSSMIMAVVNYTMDNYIHAPGIAYITL